MYVHSAFYCKSKQFSLFLLHSFFLLQNDDNTGKAARRAGIGVGVGMVFERPGELRKITMAKKHRKKQKKWAGIITNCPVCDVCIDGCAWLLGNVSGMRDLNKPALTFQLYNT